VYYRLDNEEIVFGLDLKLAPQLPVRSEVTFELDSIDWNIAWNGACSLGGLSTSAPTQRTIVPGIWSPADHRC
jgi:hypothetical protein